MIEGLVVCWIRAWHYEQPATMVLVNYRNRRLRFGEPRQIPIVGGSVLTHTLHRLVIIFPVEGGRIPPDKWNPLSVLLVRLGIWVFEIHDTWPDRGHALLPAVPASARIRGRKQDHAGIPGKRFEISDAAGWIARNKMAGPFRLASAGVQRDKVQSERQSQVIPSSEYHYRWGIVYRRR